MNRPSRNPFRALFTGDNSRRVTRGSASVRFIVWTITSGSLAPTLLAGTAAFGQDNPTARSLTVSPYRESRQATQQAAKPENKTSPMDPTPEGEVENNAIENSAETPRSTTLASRPLPAPPPADTTLSAEAVTGLAEASYEDALRNLTVRSPEHSPARARAILERLAAANDPVSLNLLGLTLDPIWFPSPHASAPEAAKLYGAAAAKGHLAADFNLAELVRKGFIRSDEAALYRKPQESAAPETSEIPASAGVSSPSQERPITLAAVKIGTPGESLDSEEIFVRFAPAVVEIKSAGNYGSGVIFGVLAPGPRGMELVAPDQSQSVQLQFSGSGAPRRIPGSEQHLFVVTNAHVVSGARSLQVGLGLLGEGESVGHLAADYVCLSQNHQEDLAFVLIKQRDLPANIEDTIAAARLFPGDIPPPKGSIVYSIGNPEGLTRTIAQGLYNGRRPEGIQFDAPISVGSSGGALVTGTGHLLGITSGFVANKDSQNLNFALPIHQVIQNLRLGQSLCRPMNP